MPVSSPSYFPPQRNTDRIVGLNAGTSQTGNRVFLAGLAAGTHTSGSDLIVIGDEALSAGTASNVNPANGIIAIGTNTFAAINSNSVDDSVAIGLNAGQRLQRSGNGQSGAHVLIGPNAGAYLAASSADVIIGDSAAQLSEGGNTGGGNPASLNVVIGYQAAQNVGTLGTVNSQLRSNVVIGANAAQGGGTLGNSAALNNSVIIGQGAASGGMITRSISAAVVIGFQTCTALASTTTTTNVVIIGPSMNISSANGCVVIGQGYGNGLNHDASGMAAVGDNINSQNQQSTFLGSNLACAGGGKGNIVIGYGAGSLLTSGINDAFLVETNVNSNSRVALLYGQIRNGNLCVGNSTFGTNTDFGNINNTNCLKILNTTSYSPGTNPIGGGFFYVNAGALHWVGTSGTDTQLAPA